MMTAPQHQNTHPSRRRQALADGLCPACETPMTAARGRLRLPVNGEAISVPSVPHLRCPQCQEVLLRDDDARRLTVDAMAIYRKRHGLLSAEEIRAIRKDLGLSQHEFARLLHLGKNTVSRWESDGNVQTAALDVLVRLLRDLPGSLEYLRRHAA